MDNIAEGLNIAEYKTELIMQTLVQESQFEQWLQFFFFLNEELNKAYNTIYQDSYYTKLYELLTTGLIYSQKVLSSLSKGRNETKKNWYDKLVNGINEIRSALAESEYDFIEYKRHNACHIFQNKYEIIQLDGSIKQKRKDKHLHKLQASLMMEIAKHGSDKGFDLYIHRLLYCKIKNLYQLLITI